MWIVRWVLITLLILALAGFLSMNSDEMVDVNYVIGKTPQIPLAFALFLAFAAGMLIHLLISIFRHFQLRAEINRQKKQVRRLQDELERLRNLAIEDELLPEEPEEERLPTQPED